MSFGNQGVNTTSGGQTVTLSNTGGSSLTITSISITGTNAGDFSETNTCGSSVAAGANCTISVTFTPTAAGSRVGAVTITDNATGSPQSVSLSGTGNRHGGRFDRIAFLIEFEFHRSNRGIEQQRAGGDAEQQREWGTND